MKVWVWIEQHVCACIHWICGMFRPGIGKRRAVRIVKGAVTPGTTILDIYPEAPSNVSFYGVPQEPCWYVFVSWDDAAHLLRSSRVILVSKTTGAILYDGCAGDEGRVVIASRK